MADKKKSFLLYTDLIHTVKQMPKEMQGDLFMTILEYVNDLNPKPEDLTIKLVFEGIKRQLKRDLLKYEEKRKQWSDAGKESARKRALLKDKQNQRTLTDVEGRSTDSTVTVNVNDTVIHNTFLERFNAISKKSFRVINAKTKGHLNARLKEGFTLEDIEKALRSACKDSFHIENKLKYITPEYITRADQLDKWLNSESKQPKKLQF